MTERERIQIEAYLPNPRDPELPENEYYYKTENGRIYQVFIDGVLPPEDMKSDELNYTVCYSHNCRRVHTYRDFNRVKKGELYDNRQDCRDDTHNHIDWWEELRDVQEAERDKKA